MAHLTKKQWNSFTATTRSDILNHMNWIADYLKNDLIKNPYNHNFNHDTTGKFLKLVLDNCNIMKNGQIEVTISINPSYQTISPKVTSQKNSNKISKKTSVNTIDSLYTWYVDYEDKSGDLCHVWTEASSKEEAIDNVKDEYWDIKEITRVRKRKE